MPPIEEIDLSPDDDLNFNELERSWSKSNHKPRPASNSTARVMHRPRGVGSEAMPIPDYFAGCEDTAKKDAEKLKWEMIVKCSQGIEMDQKVIAMMNSTITSPKVREQCYAWRKEITGFKVAIKKTRQAAAKLKKSKQTR